MSIFSKEKSQMAKGICILIMLAHHLYAFPERLDYTYDIPFFIKLGQEFGIIVGLFVFISGFGLATKPLSVRMGGAKLYKLWMSLSMVFAIFIPIGFLIGAYEFDVTELLRNLFLLESSYNHEWWFFALYVKLIFLACILSLIKNEKILIAILAIIYITCVFAQKMNMQFLTHDVRTYLPVYALSYGVCRFSVFETVEKIAERYIPNIVMRVLMYILLACILGHIITLVRPIQFLFWFLAFSLIRMPECVSRSLCYLGRHSLNIWLVHTFYCYYYCKQLFVAIADPLLAYLVLVILSLVTSILLEFIKKKFSCLKTYYS